MALLGAGDDTFIWNPGDGSDTVEGQAGFDTLVFNGANIAENIDISANGGRVRFTRDVANIIMDLNGVEQIDFNALGGADNITVNDLTGTDVTQVNIDLAAHAGGGTATARPTGDRRTARSRDDIVEIGGRAPVRQRDRPAGAVTLEPAEGPNDQLIDQCPRRQ